MATDNPGGERKIEKMDLTIEEIISDYKRAAWKAWKLTSTTGMMENLALEADPVVRLGVAWNPQTSHKVLEMLSNDEDVRVNRAAKTQLSERDEALIVVAGRGKED